MDTRHWFLVWLLGGMIICNLAVGLEGMAQDVAGVGFLLYFFGGLTGWLIYPER